MLMMGGEGAAMIALEERFVVAAPPGIVWDFLIDPRRVVRCVPGGELAALVDDRTFDGKVRVRVGMLSFAYGGRLRIAEADPAARRVKIVGGAHESAGPGSARLTLVSWLTPLGDGSTEVVALARVDVEGRVVELGRGLLQRLAHEVFQDFAKHVHAALEAEGVTGRRRRGREAPRPSEGPPLRAVAIAVRAFRAWVSGWWRRPGLPEAASRRRAARQKDAR
jgi:carbon monoxide dehydrogenase subunit G